MTAYAPVTLFVCTLAAVPVTSAQEVAVEGDAELEGAWDSRGELALEGRAFPNDDDTRTEDQNLGLFGRLEASWERGNLKGRGRGYGRADHFDSGRATVALEEAWLQWRSEHLRLRVGWDLVNWTATEAFHPADILNARNLDSDLENYEKLGEPMAVLALSLPTDTTVEFIGLGALTEPSMTSPRSRLALAPPGVVLGPAVMTDRDGETLDADYAPQGALRLRQVVGGADVALQVVHHVDRSEPVILLDLQRFRPRPVFQTVTHAGLTYQHVLDALVVKVEAARRHFHDAVVRYPLYGVLPSRDHTKVAVGLEYGFVHEAGSESTVIVEGQAVFGLGRAERITLTPFQRDVLAGYRFAFNDEPSRELLLTAIVDLEREREGLASVSYAQRLGDTWSLRLAARVLEAKKPKELARGLQALREADVIKLTMTRHF